MAGYFPDIPSKFIKIRPHIMIYTINWFTFIREQTSWNREVGGAGGFCKEGWEQNSTPSLPQAQSFQETPPGTTWPEASLPNLQTDRERQSDRAAVVRFLWPCIVSKVWREKKNQKDATIRCLLLTSVSTCFGHHYAHPQANKDRVTAFGVLFWFCWMWLVAVVGRCLVGCEHYEGLCSY